MRSLTNLICLKPGDFLAQAAPLLSGLASAAQMDNPLLLLQHNSFPCTAFSGGFLLFWLIKTQPTSMTTLMIICD